jgi:hypothetical protein
MRSKAIGLSTPPNRKDVSHNLEHVGSRFGFNVAKEIKRLMYKQFNTPGGVSSTSPCRKARVLNLDAETKT